MLLISWLNEVFRSPISRVKSRRSPGRLQTTPLVGRTELLEDRTLLAAVTFINDNWAFVTDNEPAMSSRRRHGPQCQRPDRPRGHDSPAYGSGTVGKLTAS